MTAENPTVYYRVQSIKLQPR